VPLVVRLDARIVMGASTVVLLLLAATSPKPLELARDRVRTLKYAQAAKALKATARLEGLSRAQALEYFELSGIVAASLGDQEAARAAFVKLLALDSGWKLKGRPSPRVTTPFYEARSQVNDQGGLALTYTGAEPNSGPPEALLFSLHNVPALARDVAFTVVEDGVERALVLPASPTLRVPVRGSQVSALGVARTAQRWVLTGAVESTVHEQADTPLAAPPLPLPEPGAAAATAGPPPLAATTASAPSLLRPAAYTALGVAVLAAAVGGAFGIGAQAARGRFLSATSEGGLVTTLTREQALGLEADARAFSVVANACFIGAGVAGVTGVVLWLLGLRAASVTPVGGGAVATFALDLPR
jgi:hypothetical protein